MDRYSAEAGIRQKVIQTGPFKFSKLQQVIRILVDSAALYTLSLIAWLVTYIPKNNAYGYYETSDAVRDVLI